MPTDAPTASPTDFRPGSPNRSPGARRCWHAVRDAPWALNRPERLKARCCTCARSAEKTWRALLLRFLCATYGALDAALRGVSQVYFVSNPLSGVVMLGAITGANPLAGGAVALSAMSATITASLWGFDRKRFEDGLYAYDAVLLGAAVAVFWTARPEESAATHAMSVLCAALVGGSLSAFASAAVARFGQQLKLPSLTLAFQLCTWGSLLATQRAAHVEALGAPASLSTIVALGTNANSSAAATDHFAHDDFARSELHGERSALGFVRALFSGVAQAYLVGGGDAWWSGLLVALAIALSSPLLCVLVLVASAIGLCTALLLGASPDESVANGLYVVCKCGAAGRGGMMLYTRPS